MCRYLRGWSTLWNTIGHDRFWLFNTLSYLNTGFLFMNMDQFGFLSFINHSNLRKTLICGWWWSVIINWRFIWRLGIHYDRFFIPFLVIFYGIWWRANSAVKCGSSQTFLWRLNSFCFVSRNLRIVLVIVNAWSILSNLAYRR